MILVSEIQRRVCAHYGISEGDLLGSSRVRRLSYPRHVAMFLSASLTGQSGLAIARRFNRDHSTLRHAVKRIETDRKWDPTLNVTLTAIAAGLMGDRP